MTSSTGSVGAGGNCFPPQTMTACHTCVTPQPFNPRQPCAVSNRGLVRATHANARGLHNPQPMLRPFRRQDRKHAAHQLEYLAPTGFRWSQHDDADVPGGRVGPDVREIEVESEEHARACLAGRCNSGSSAPASPSSSTESHSQPAVRRSSAASTGRFSSSFARIRRSYAGRGRTRSWASSEAYANAA